MNFELARQKMVDNQIRPSDVTDHKILSAFLSVPREEFFASEIRDLAYLDRDHDLDDADGAKRSMLNPAMLAKLIQLTGVDTDDVVLLVGSGLGYTATLFAELASSVVAIEEDAGLVNRSNENLTRLGVANAAVIHSSFSDGYENEAPFDVIFVEGSVEYLPEAWTDQLAEGGRLVVVVGAGASARASVYTKNAGLIGSVSEFNCFAAPIPGFENKPEFAL